MIIYIPTFVLLFININYCKEEKIAIMNVLHGNFVLLFVCFTYLAYTL